MTKTDDKGSEKVSDFNSDRLGELFKGMEQYVNNASHEGTPIHDVERTLWGQVLQIGKQLLGKFIAQQGNGDLGDEITLPDGQILLRFAKPGKRTYRSVFGNFAIERTVYGKREGQKIEFAPLDNRLLLPESEHSHLLHDWTQHLSTECPFHKVHETLKRILFVNPSTESLERINHKMGDDVESFWNGKTAPPAAKDGEFVVATADGKGIPITRPADTRPIEEHQHKKGPKPNRKKIAIVGSAYTVAPHFRSPEQVVSSLFREPGSNQTKDWKRPSPQHKHIRAALTREVDGQQVNAMDVIFPWLGKQVQDRCTQNTTPVVIIMDGQKSLWGAAKKNLPQDRIEILDLLHVTPRIWNAANLFYSAGSDEALSFVKTRVEKILNGNISRVVAGIRRMAKSRSLPKNRKEQLNTDLDYLLKNKKKMMYGEYLEKGYPIASGVIEGACRHIIKDRMERTGMRWTINGAQSMLNVRCVTANDEWDDFLDHRIQKEMERIYPYKSIVDRIEWPIAA